MEMPLSLIHFPTGPVGMAQSRPQKQAEAKEGEKEKDPREKRGGRETGRGSKFRGQ